MLIYCDSVVLIYWLDQIGPFHLRAERRMMTLQAASDQVAVSDLTRLECRVGPLKRKDPVILAVFDAFFARSDVQIVPLTPAVFDRAAQMRADLGFKTPDALHLAAAIEAGCHSFLTNDARLSRRTDIPIEILP
jgi:predicted nucleic acid-binding protein